MKKVLLSVSCINEYADDFPGLYCAELTPETIARIMHLSKTVKDVHAFKISEFNSCGTWSNADADSDPSFEDVSCEDNEARVDVCQLVVTGTDFYWTAVPKHLGDDMGMTTARVPVDFLTGDDNEFTKIN